MEENCTKDFEFELTGYKKPNGRKQAKDRIIKDFAKEISQLEEELKSCIDHNVAKLKMNQKWQEFNMKLSEFNDESSEVEVSLIRTKEFDETSEINEHPPINISVDHECLQELSKEKLDKVLTEIKYEEEYCDSDLNSHNTSGLEDIEARVQRSFDEQLVSSIYELTGKEKKLIADEESEDYSSIGKGFFFCC